MRRAVLLAALMALLLAVSVAASASAAASSSPSSSSRVMNTLGVVANSFTVMRPNARSSVLVGSTTPLTITLSSPVALGNTLTLSAECTIAGKRISALSSPWFTDVFPSTLAELTPKAHLSTSLVSFVTGQTVAQLNFTADISVAEMATCVFEFLAGDASFEDAPAVSLCIPVAVPTLSFTGIGATGHVIIGSTTQLKVVTEVAPLLDTEFAVSCTDDQDAVPVQNFYVTVLAGTTVSTPFGYLAGNVAAYVTCSITITDRPGPLACIDPRFLFSRMPLACFNVDLPKCDWVRTPTDCTPLDELYSVFPTSVLTSTTTPFTLTTNGPVIGSLAFQLTCGLVGQPAAEVFDFAIADGQSHVTFSYTAPPTAPGEHDAAVYSCAVSLNLAASTDLRFTSSSWKTGSPPPAFKVFQPTIQVIDLSDPTTKVQLYSYTSFTWSLAISDVAPLGFGLTLQTECVPTGGGALVGVTSDAQFASHSATSSLCFTGLTDYVGEVTCTVRYKSTGDADFVAYTASTATFVFDIVAPTLTASATNNILALTIGATTEISITSSIPVLSFLEGAASCNNGATIASTWTIAEGQTVLSALLLFQAPLTAQTVLCTFSATKGDVRFTSSPINSLTFTISAPLLSVSGITAGAELIAGQEAALTLTADRLVPTTASVTVAVTCTAVGASDSIAPFDLVIGTGVVDTQSSGPKAFTLLSNLISSTPAAVTCSFGAASVTGTGADVFVGFNAIPNLSFTVRPPTLTYTTTAVGTHVVASVPHTFTVTAEVATKGAITLPLKCKVGSLVDAFVEASVVIASGSNSVSVTLSAQLLGLHVCDLDGVVDATNDVAFEFATNISLPLTFTVVPPTFSCHFPPGPLVVNDPCNITLTINNGSTPNTELIVPVVCGGETIEFVFPPGESTCTRPYTPGAPGNGQGVELGPIVTGPDCFTGTDGAKLDDSSKDLQFDVVVPSLTLNGLSNGAQLLTGSLTTPLSLTASPAVNAPTVYKLKCKIDGTTYATFLFTFAAAGHVNGAGTMDDGAGGSVAAVLSLPLTATSTISCASSFVSGDDRFSAALQTVVVSAVLPTVSLSHSGSLVVGSTSSLVLSLSTGAAGGAAGVKYDVACSGGSVGAGARFNVASGATSASLAYFATGVSAGPITCSLTFVAGSDARFTNAALTPTTFTLTAAVNPGSSSSSSTGGNNNGGSASSSSSSGSNDAAGGSSGGGGGGGNFLAAGEGSGSSGLSDGAKAAIAVGVIMGVGLLAAIIYVLVTKFGLGSAAGAGAAGGAASAGVPVTGPAAV